MGKYSTLRNELQRYEPIDGDYKFRVNQRKADLGNLSRAEVSELFKRAKRRKKKLESIEKKINLEIEATETLLASLLESSGEESFKSTLGGSFSIKDEVYVTVKDKKAYSEWAKSNGYEDEFQMHHKKTESIVNERLLNGEPPPPGVEVFMKLGINARGIYEKE